jgi:hypothetical protein
MPVNDWGREPVRVPGPIRYGADRLRITSFIQAPPGSRKKLPI